MSEKIPGPAYRIETARLVVRCWEPADAQALLDAISASLEHLRSWMPWAQHEPKSLQEEVTLLRQFRGKFDLGQDFTYGVFTRDETQVVGGTGLHTRRGEDAREIGYWIHADHVRQGYATEVAAALTKVAFEVDEVQRVEIRCDPENRASAAIPKKLGFTHEATRRRLALGADGDLRDTMIWTLLADEYPGSPSSAAAVAAFDAIGRRIL